MRHFNCSSGDRLFGSYIRCIVALVYQRACTLGKCLRVHDLYFMDAGRWRTPVCPPVPYSPRTCRVIRWNNAFCGRIEPPESRNYSFGAGTSVVLADVSCRHYHDRLCILCALRSDGTV